MMKQEPKLYVPLGFGLVLSIIWVVQIMTGYIPYIDQLSRGIVDTVQGTATYTFFLHITEFGSREFLIPFTIVVAILFLVLYRNFWPSVIFAGGTLCSHLLNQLIKHIVGRERPSLLEEANALGNSFPSGHAMTTVVCYGLVFYFVSKKMKSKIATWFLGTATILFVLLIGLSRFFINVHYITDVVAGFLFGFILLFVFIYLYGEVMKKES